MRKVYRKWIWIPGRGMCGKCEYCGIVLAGNPGPNLHNKHQCYKDASVNRATQVIFHTEKE